MGRLHRFHPRRRRQRHAGGDVAGAGGRIDEASAGAPLRARHHRRAVDGRRQARVPGRLPAVDDRSAESRRSAGAICGGARLRPSGFGGPRRRRGDVGEGAKPRWPVDGRDRRQAAGAARPGQRDRLRTTARRAVQGSHVRLEGLPARRPAVPRAEPPDPAGGAGRPRAGRRRRSQGAGRPRPASHRPLVASGRQAARLRRRSRLARRTEIRKPRSLDGHHRRAGHAADRRRVCLQRRGLLARWQATCPTCAIPERI